ncbi:protein phosphatase, partial [Duganella callida]
APPPQLHIDNLSAIVLRFGSKIRENVDETALPVAAIPSHF